MSRDYDHASALSFVIWILPERFSSREASKRNRTSLNRVKKGYFGTLMLGLSNPAWPPH